MSDRRYTINWVSGDKDQNLTRREMQEITAENKCQWLDSNIIGSDGKIVGLVSRDDPY